MGYESICISNLSTAT